MILENGVALITGAGSGIGAAAAIRLAREGARIAALSRTARDLEECEQIGHCESDVIPVVADVSNPDRDADCHAQGAGEMGSNRHIANAGVNGVWAPLDELTTRNGTERMAIDLRGTFLSVKCALPALRVRGGSVVITSDVNSTRMFSNSGATACACGKVGAGCVLQNDGAGARARQDSRRRDLPARSRRIFPKTRKRAIWSGSRCRLPVSQRGVCR